MSPLAFEGRVVCRRGNDSFEIIGEGGGPIVRVPTLRSARRIAKDAGPLAGLLPAMTRIQPLDIHIGSRLRVRLSGTERAQMRAAVAGRLLGLPLTRLWYAPRTER